MIRIYKNVIGSIAPSIYGYEEVKEALSMQLFSGVPKHLPDGSRVRGDITCFLLETPVLQKARCYVIW
ncbi:MAG: hypothetical protein R2741_11900 [Methanolobus sp.]